MYLLSYLNSRCEKCKRICLSPFVTFVLLEGIALILLSNLRTRFFLRGVGCDAPGFNLGLFNANDRVDQIKHMDFGHTLVNLSHHFENLANITSGQPLVKA
jgi:hypothetical protein